MPHATAAKRLYLRGILRVCGACHLQAAHTECGSVMRRRQPFKEGENREGEFGLAGGGRFDGGATRGALETKQLLEAIDDAGLFALLIEGFENVECFRD